MRWTNGNHAAKITLVAAAKNNTHPNPQTDKKIAHKRKQERPAVADRPARRLRNVCTVYVRAVGL